MIDGYNPEHPWIEMMEEENLKGMHEKDTLEEHISIILDYWNHITDGLATQSETEMFEKIARQYHEEIIDYITACKIANKKANMLNLLRTGNLIETVKDVSKKLEDAVLWKTINDLRTNSFINLQSENSRSR